jgi:tetratricopeptide (TPR) repeat protein
VGPDSDYFVDARVHLAYLYQRREAYDRAILEAQRALAIKKDDPELMGILASLYRDKGDRKKAIEILERIVALVPNSDRYHFTLGAVYDEAKDKERCIAHMQKAIELNPNNAAALNYLGYTWAEQGINLDDAENLIRRALDLAPDDGFYVDSLGWVYYQRGAYEDAVEHLERAVELAGDDPTIMEHLGDAYDKTGRTQDALRLYRAALVNAEAEDQQQRLRDKIRVLEGKRQTTGPGL